MNRIFMLAALLMAVLMPAQAASTRYTVFVSDLHVGAGKLPNGEWNRIEDFRWQSDFNAFLDMVSARSRDHADLVLAGDVFELWQSPSMVCSTDLARPGCEVKDCNDKNTEIGCSEAEAVARLAFVLDHHPDFIDAIQRFATRGNNTVHFVPGNHDGALTFPGVRDALLAKFRDARVSVESKGYWLSADGVVYSDHGHQFDELNAFPKWPEPFVTVKDRRYLAKPWGENMVQQFYNQYESVYPIIDNLSDEKTGVEYAVKQAGFRNSADAVRRFFRFFLYEESLAQAAGALGKGGTQWDYKAVRKQPTGFFTDIIPGDLRPAPQQVHFSAAALSDREIDAICSAKKQDNKRRQCARVADGLGAAAGAVLVSDEKRLAAYLLAKLPKVAEAGKPIAAVYVYGHTHRAVKPATLQIGETGHGSAEIVTVNTGAFQRITSPDQIATILRQPGNEKRQPLDLSPDELPACYSFVLIEPYNDSQADPQLFRWSKGSTGFSATKGTCL
jgi:UDP-2,3-diacylglucosamine pyrophosphatase LpxH